MNVVVGSVVAGDELKRVPREGIAAVVINGLDSRESEEASALEQRHASHLESDTSTESVEKEAFKGVVVKSTVSVWNIETVVSGVEGGVEPAVDMHQSVKEVLPGVENEDGNKVLQGRNEDVVDGLCKGKFPGSKGRGGAAGGGFRDGIVASSQSSGKERIGSRHALGDGGGIESDKTEETGQRTLGKADASCPDGNVVVSLANHLLGLSDGQCVACCNLDDLLDDDIAGNFVACRVVALGDFFGRVKTELRKEVEHVDGVEEERRRPVDGNWEKQRQPEVRDPREQIGLWLKRVGRQRRKRRIVEAVVGHDGSLGGEVVHDVGNAVDHAQRADGARCWAEKEKKSVEI